MVKMIAHAFILSTYICMGELYKVVFRAIHISVFNFYNKFKLYALKLC